jgi:hypothetical protein
MVQWAAWGRRALRDGDIVFRLGDARLMRGIFPVSLFIAGATGSPFSHTGIVAIEDETPVVYDCSGDGVQRQPFEVWVLDNVGAFAVKRLKAEHRRHIPGVVGYCRTAFEKEVPFDYLVRQDDAALYCRELTEKAFRSQGLKLSEPIRLGDWENLGEYALTALALPYVTGLVLEQPISLEQAVFLPGNDHHGVWASPLLETVIGTKPERGSKAARDQSGGPRLRGDIQLLLLAGREVRRSYRELPLWWIGRLAIRANSLGPAPPSTVSDDRTRVGLADPR